MELLFLPAGNLGARLEDVKLIAGAVILDVFILENPLQGVLVKGSSHDDQFRFVRNRLTSDVYSFRD